MNFVSVAAFPSIVDLSMAKTCLREHGIEYYVRDEHTAQVSEKYRVLTGGIKLDVKAEDAPEAIKLLTEHGFIKPEAPAEPTAWDKLSGPQRVLVFLIAFIIVLAIAYLGSSK